MTETSLEERVSKLERIVDVLLQQSAVTTREKDWRRTVGMFDDDPLMKEIIEEGKRVRDEDRRNSRI